MPFLGLISKSEWEIGRKVRAPDIDLAYFVGNCNQSKKHFEIKPPLKISNSRKQILKFSFEPKTNESIFVFLP